MKTKLKINTATKGRDDGAKELSACLASRGPRVDWIKTEKNVTALWFKWIRAWPDREDYKPSELAEGHARNVSNSMKLLKKISRQVTLLNKSRREPAL